MTRLPPLVVTLLATAFLCGGAAAAGNAEAGATLYAQRCSLCHSVDENGTGPAHRGVFGRRAGAAPAYLDYSPALRRSGIVWDERTLDAWLADPERLVPGQGMDVSVDDAAARADLVAYLRSLTAR